MPEQQKKILSRFEWFLLIVALGILAIVLMQNQGIHPIETVESTEITDANNYDYYKDKAPRTNSERLNNLTDYFAKNRAAAKAEGKDVGFNWSSLKIEEDEEKYLKDKYGNVIEKEPTRDWLSAISDSYNTYKSVKSTFAELGIDTDEFINAENASKALSNPIIANSIYQKMEEDFGIPAERSRDFAEKNKQNLEKWAGFVEQELSKN
ncbi:MAG: hypothetical protein AAGJ18_21560 [Bacteroidota bacterium]